MRRLIGEIITLTIFIGVFYIATLFQQTYFGRTILTIDLATIVVIYALLLAYILLGYNKYTLSFKPFALAIAFFFILEVIVFNLFEYSPIIYTFFQSNKLEVMLLLAFLALAHVELPVKTRFQPVITAVGLILAGYLGYSLISTVPMDYSTELGLVFLLIMVVFSATVFSNITENEFTTWLRNSRKFLLFFIIVIAAYYISIRPMLEKPGLINLVEWGIVIIVLLKLSRDYKRNLNIDESEFIEPHKQRISIRSDEWVDEFRRAQDGFIQNGIKSHFIAALTKPLYDMDWSEERVAVFISAVVSHTDRRVPFFSFKWERRMIENKNQKEREEIVDDLIERLNKEGVDIAR
ncbi:MAG: hypothetical protein R6U44_06960 [Archaeoglobaceae archaeon]